MDKQAMEFMAREMLTTDVITEKQVGKMFVQESQAGDDVAREGANLRRLQQRYALLPKCIPGCYPDEEIDRATYKLIHRGGK